MCELGAYSEVYLARFEVRDVRGEGGEVRRARPEYEGGQLVSEGGSLSDGDASLHVEVDSLMVIWRMTT